MWRIFPLVWLGYLFFPIRAYLSAPHSPWLTALALAALLAFTGVWINIYTRRIWKQHQALIVSGFAACLLMYTLGLLVVGYDSATFLVYAGALIGYQASLRVGVWGMAIIVAALLTPGWVGFLRPGLGHLGLVDLVQILVLTLVALWGNHAAYRQTISSIRLARVQAEKEKLAADAERERIARDLHDLLGHTLSVIVLKSELARKLAERDPARAIAEIADVERISREALGEVRSAVRGYRGSGLSAELARSKVALDAAGVRLELDAPELHSGGLNLPAAVEYAMEMVVREAVTNIVRHAHARHATVRVLRDGQAFVLEVRDDGTSRSDGPHVEGTGLTSMRERVRATGGDVQVSRRNGTCLRASFPLEAQASAQTGLRRAGA
ncbi:sensor histidine kinase [Deinococcus sp. KNUC1210]|uniref:sensor histidine kinase n=1 Tax=Deinococcus sp. KNUC1210 TaxID=2917691 RepID=UPI001EF096FF|nr:sensor histidine kinase [Deinococcus sp. KNUC1210]ULH15334.1 sensor histidine kinase [Deinococcus sp. KNUC1210]